MTLSGKQRIAMAVIVLSGLGAGIGVLMAGRATPAEGRGPNETKPGAAREAWNGKELARPTSDEERETIHLTAASIEAAGIESAASGPATLRTSSDFQGEVQFNDDRTAHVVPRLAGVAEAVSVSLGQSVRKGQILAVLASTGLSDQRSELLTAQKRRDLARTTYAREKRLWEENISAQQDFQQAQGALQEADIAVANASQKLAAVGAGAGTGGLNRFEIRAPFDGTIVEKHLALGEAVKEDTSIFTISDLDTVWVEFVVSPRDLATVRVGQDVVVSSSAFEGKVAGTVSYVGSLLGERTRTAKARVTLTNPDAAWRPGLFVTVSVKGASQPVAIGLMNEAVQTIEDKPTVFVETLEGYEVRHVKVGRSDANTVEIVGGLKAGERVAVKNAFVLKSELGKDSADHGH